MSEAEQLNLLAYVYGIARSACETTPNPFNQRQDRRQLELIQEALAPLFASQAVITKGEPR